MPLPTIQIDVTSEDLIQGYGITTIENTLAVTQGPNAIPYLELGDYKESFGQDDSLATRYLLCLWEHRYWLRSDLLGTSFFKAGATFNAVTTNLVRQPPEQHPEEPWLYASKVDIEPLGVPTPYRDNIIRALAGAPKYTPEGDQGANPSFNSDTSQGSDPTAPISTATASIYANVPQLSQQGESGMVTFNLAKCTVTYTPREYDVDVVQPNLPYSLSNPKMLPAPALPVNSPTSGGQSPAAYAPPANPGPATAHVVLAGKGELGRFIVRNYKETTENQTIPGSGFKYFSDSTPSRVSFGF